MARIADWYFRLATILVSLALVQVHAASETVFPICQFRHDDKIAEDGTNLLVARGNGSVTLQDVTCTCHIGKPVVTVFFFEGESGSNHSLTSPICEGDVDPSCEGMPEKYEHIDENKVSKVNITGTFNKTAVIECGTLMNPNKASPLIVLVEPVPVSTPSQSTSVVPSPSEIVVTTTATTEDDDDSTDVIDSNSFSSTTVESPACTTLTNILTTTLTVFASDYMSQTPTFNTPTVAEVIEVIIPTTATVISILIIIIVVLLVVVTVAIIIARSNHRSGKEQISATNQIAIEHKEIHTEV